MGLRYTKTKIFHFKAKLDSLPRRSGPSLPPLHIRIKPTNLCCHRCRYCAYGRDFRSFGKDDVRRVFIPRVKMMEIIDDVIGMGVKAVTFSGGGEPFIYPHLVEAVRKLARSPVKFASLTNASRLEGEAAELFAARGTWIRVSIDGWDGPSYARYRGVSESEFARVMGNIGSFKKLGGGCALGVSLIVDATNAPHVYRSIKQLKEAGADSVKVSPCLVNDSAAANNEFHKPIFRKVKDQVRRALADLAGPGFEVFDAYARLDGKFAKDYSWCPYLQVLPVIGADLNVYACPDKAYNLRNGALGSLKGVRLRDFWRNGREKFFRIDPSRDCGHHCEANEKNRVVLEYLGADPEHLNFV